MGLEPAWGTERYLYYRSMLEAGGGGGITFPVLACSNLCDSLKMLSCYLDAPSGIASPNISCCCPNSAQRLSAWLLCCHVLCSVLFPFVSFCSPLAHGKMVLLSVSIATENAEGGQQGWEGEKKAIKSDLVTSSNCDGTTLERAFNGPIGSFRIS